MRQNGSPIFASRSRLASCASSVIFQKGNIRFILHPSSFILSTVLLFCCHTPAHEVLYRQVFLPSVPEGFEVRSTVLGIDGPGDYLSDEFLRCIRAKLDLVVRSVEENLGDIIVWSDVDIRFFDLSPSALAAELESSACDVLFQRESPRMDDVNTGFFVCRCTPCCPRILHDRALRTGIPSRRKRADGREPTS